MTMVMAVVIAMQSNLYKTRKCKQKNDGIALSESNSGWKMVITIASPTLDRRLNSNGRQKENKRVKIAVEM